MRKMLIVVIAEALGRLRRTEHGDERNEDIALSILGQCEDLLPHGSGLDGNVAIEIEKSSERKIVVGFEFHHINKNGFYCGWTSGKVVFRPEFDGFSTKIFGDGDKKSAQIRDYMHDVFSYAMGTMVDMEFDSETKEFTVKETKHVL